MADLALHDRQHLLALVHCMRLMRAARSRIDVLFLLFADEASLLQSCQHTIENKSDQLLTELPLRNTILYLASLVGICHMAPVVFHRRH